VSPITRIQRYELAKAIREYLLKLKHAESHSTRLGVLCDSVFDHAVASKVAVSDDEQLKAWLITQGFSDKVAKLYVEWLNENYGP
jgi:hypothetical protein